MKSLTKVVEISKKEFDELNFKVILNILLNQNHAKNYL